MKYIYIRGGKTGMTRWIGSLTPLEIGESSYVVKLVNLL